MLFRATLKTIHVAVKVSMILTFCCFALFDFASHPDVVAQSIPSARVIAWSQDGLLALAGGGDSCNPNNPNEFNISIIDPNTLLTMHILSGLTCRAQSLSWSPDGDRIAAASFDGFGVTIWDVYTSQILAKDITGEQGVMSVAWNVDGTLIAVGYMNNFVAIIDASTGARVNSLDMGGTFVDWSADENRLAVASAYHNSVYIDDLDAQNAAIKLVGHTEPVMDLEWNTAGTRIASGSRDTSIRIWSANSGQSILTFNHTGIVDAVAWRPNTNQLASADRDGVLRLWETNTGLLVEQFTITGQVTSIDWNADGSELAYVGLNQTLQIVEPSPIPTATPTATLTSTPTASPTPVICDALDQIAHALVLICDGSLVFHVRDTHLLAIHTLRLLFTREEGDHLLQQIVLAR